MQLQGLPENWEFVVWSYSQSLNSLVYRGFNAAAVIT